MNAPTIFGEKPDKILADVGLALLLVKTQRGLTLTDMASKLARCDDMVAKYIAGEAEMGFIAWERAKTAWPELADRLAETAEDRAARARQRALDLNLTHQRAAA